MTGAVYVERARSCLDGLLRAESRGPGDLQNAIRRIARREGLPFSSLWALRYRPPKDCYASVLFKLSEAYGALQEHQLQALEADIEAAKQAGVAGDRVAAAAAVARRAREG